MTSALSDVADQKFDFVIAGRQSCLRAASVCVADPCLLQAEAYVAFPICVTENRRLILRQTAGLTVAARLTEDPNISVAVLEAGAANIDDPLLGMPKSLLYRISNDLISTTA